MSPFVVAIGSNLARLWMLRAFEQLGCNVSHATYKFVMTRHALFDEYQKSLEKARHMKKYEGISRRLTP